MLHMDRYEGQLPLFPHHRNADTNAHYTTKTNVTVMKDNFLKSYSYCGATDAK